MMGSFGGLGGRLSLANRVLLILKIKCFREISERTIIMEKSKDGSLRL